MVVVISAVIVGFIAGLILAISGQNGGCTPGWIPFADRCILLDSVHLLEWREAKATCQSYGATLLRFETSGDKVTRTAHSGAVAMSSVNGLVGTGFAFRYRLQPKAGF